MRFTPPVPIHEYIPWLCRVAPRNAVALAPLIEGPFNESKSELKWLEYATIGLPTVASQTGPYRRAVSPGSDGLLAQSNGAWRKAVAGLLEAPQRQQEIVSAAQARVHGEYDASKRACDWIETYDSLFGSQLWVPPTSNAEVSIAHGQGRNSNKRPLLCWLGQVASETIDGFAERLPTRSTDTEVAIHAKVS